MASIRWPGVGAGTVLTGAVGTGGMSTWVALVEVVDAEFQDLQELASLWGDINVELGEVDAELQETYALLVLGLLVMSRRIV